MLREAGMEANDFEDLSTVQEKTLGALVKEKASAHVCLVTLNCSKVL